MFWVKTAFRVGWDTGFQPLGWATSSTAALSLWREKARGTRKRETDRQTEDGIKDCKRQWSAMNKGSWDCKRFGFAVWRRPVLSLSLSVKDSRRREGTGRSRGVSLLTQTRKNAWTDFHCYCDWIHFCGLGCVFRSSSRSLHAFCVGGTHKALCLHSVLWVGNHWAEHVLLLCIYHKSFVLSQCRHTNIVYN